VSRCAKDGQNKDILSRASELICKGERPKGGPGIKSFNFVLEVIKERKMSWHQIANCWKTGVIPDKVQDVAHKSQQHTHLHYIIFNTINGTIFWDMASLTTMLFRDLDVPSPTSSCCVG